MKAQLISIASPILVFRHVISNVETFIELAIIGTPDDVAAVALLYIDRVADSTSPLQPD